MVYEQRGGYRYFLNRYYPNIAPDRIVITAMDPNDLVLARNLLGVYLGLDRPLSLANHVCLTHMWETKKRMAFIGESPSVFLKKLRGADLILWIWPSDFQRTYDATCKSGSEKSLCQNYQLLIETCKRAYEVDFPARRLTFFEPERDRLGPRGEFDDIPVEQ